MILQIQANIAASKTREDLGEILNIVDRCDLSRAEFDIFEVSWQTKLDEIKVAEVLG